jgi:hypothetical protein
MESNKSDPNLSMMAFLQQNGTLKKASDMSLSVAGRDAGRADRSGLVFAPCVIGAMVATCLLGKPTSYLDAHKLYHTLTKKQVTLIHRTVCM